MGVYSSNRGYLGMNYNSDEVVANENYVGVVGAGQMLIDNAQNNAAMFEAVLCQDFEEAIALKNGTLLESELSMVTEASFGGFVDKIKEMLHKGWEKIKGMIKSFIVKITNVFVRDNKSFVEKYKADILKKDLSKMKYKWSKPKAKYFDISKATADSLKQGVISWDEIPTTPDAVSKFVEDKFDDNKLLESVLGGAVGSSTSVSEFSKDFHEACFEDESEEEGLSTAALTDIMNELLGAKKSIENINKCQKDVDKFYSDALKEVDKARNAIVKTIPKDVAAGTSVKVGDKEVGVNNANRAGINAALNALYTGDSILQNGASRVIAATMTELKFGLAQDRRVFAQAAAYNPKTVKEDAVLFDAIGESAAYEVEEMFSNYEN